MARVVDTQAYLDAVVHLLAQGRQEIPVTVSGNSMCPFLHPGDTVFLSPAPQRLRRGQIVLFVRQNGRYILHRIHKVNPDGSFLMLGDNQCCAEPVPGRDRIRALATGARIDKHDLTPASLRWKFYAHVWSRLVWLRPLIGKIWNRKA